MVYSSKFVLAVIVDGKIQKELANGVVPINFEKEFALRFRNKNDRRALVKFTIDGENVSGGGYIVPANDFINIHRYFDKDAKFKFVDLESPEAVDHGKNGPNHDGSKGVVEAKFYLEKSQPVKQVEHHHYYPWVYPYPQWTNTAPGYGDLYCGSSQMPMSFNSCNTPSINNFVAPQPTIVPSLLQEGCTVEGVKSGQIFVSDYIDPETDFTLLRCVLKGIPKNEASVVEISHCTNCGAKKTRKADSFCGVCGKKF